MTPRANITNTEILSDDYFTLSKITFTYTKKDGSTETQIRESFDVGNAATVLLYNKEQQTVILTRQFRLSSFLNGNHDGMLIEACAGKLDAEHPKEAILREIEEETGYKVPKVEKVFEAYMSPGSLTELLHFYVAEYTAGMKQNEGGGVAHEQEEIEVLELPFAKALLMIASGEIRDAKTIMLLQFAKLQLMPD